jgi:hypothetical protein
MSGELTADEIRSLLELEPNATCGFVRVTFVSKQAVAAGELPVPFADARPLGSALYFLVTPGAPVRLHRIRNDQLYHYLSAIRSRCSCCMPTAARSESSSDLTCAAASVQLLIPGNTFHTARLVGRRRWFLGASTEWPGVIPADVEIGDLDALAGKYPSVAAELRAIAASVEPDTPIDRK